MNKDQLDNAPAPRSVDQQQACSPFVRSNESNDYSRSAIYAVHGFWSGDNVRVSQRRHYKTAEWESPQVNWSCGGRESETEPDDIKAAECFALAILDAASVARQWMANAQADTRHE